MSYKSELDNMIWSFSRIHLWEQCPYAFYLQYIEQPENSADNFWAENGKAVHLTLEKFFKGELTADDMPSFYMSEFENIVSTASRTTVTKVFEACLDFFCEFDFGQFDHYEILGVEKECLFTVGKYPFRGIIDLLLRDKRSNDIIILDHKTSTYPLTKDGKGILKNYRTTYDSYKHQMYLYCKPIIEEYGVEPTKIMWLYVKAQKILILPFARTEYDETLKWAENIIDGIYRDRAFEAKTSYVMCNMLCSFRNGECAYTSIGDI